MEQNSLPRVRVVNPNDDWLGTEYYINGQKIDRVRSVDFRVAVDEVPTFAFEMMGWPDTDMHGNIQFSFTPETVEEAVKVLRNELLKHSDIFNGFKASILSAIEDINKSPNGMTDSELVEHIMKRIVGED